MFFHRILLALLLAIPIATTASAQKFDWRAVLEQSVKAQMKVDTQFEFSKKRSVPVHFTMGVPLAENKLITRTRFPEQQGNLGEFMFLSPDEKLLEFVTISVGTVAAGTLEERMNRVFSLIEKQVYPSVTPPPNAKVLGGRKTTIAGHPAVEYVSLFENPDRGPVAARIVGVLTPDERNVLFFVQQTMRKEMELAGPDELAKTFGGAMLSSLTFQAYRDKAGTLTEF